MAKKVTGVEVRIPPPTPDTHPGERSGIICPWTRDADHAMRTRRMASAITDAKARLPFLDTWKVIVQPGHIENVGSGCCVQTQTFIRVAVITVASEDNPHNYDQHVMRTALHELSHILVASYVEVAETVGSDYEESARNVFHNLLEIEEEKAVWALTDTFLALMPDLVAKYD